MKPKKQKLKNACRAMEHFGIRAAKTTKALTKLLKVYENNWELIEDENYKALFDFLMPEDEGMSSSHQGAPSHVKTENDECPGQGQQSSMPILKSCLDSTPSRGEHKNDSGKPLPLLRRARLRGQEGAFIHDSKKVESKNKVASPYDETEVVELPAKRLYTRAQKKQALFTSKPSMETNPWRTHQSSNDLFSDAEDAQPLLIKRGPKAVKSKDKEAPAYDGPEAVELQAKRLKTRHWKESHPLLRNSVVRGQEGPIICDSKGVVYNRANSESPSNGVTEVVELPINRWTSQQKREAHYLPRSCKETTPSTMAQQNDSNLVFYDSEESEDCSLLHSRYQGRKEKMEVSGNPPPAKSPIVICPDSSSDSEGCNVDEDREEVLNVEPLIGDYKSCVSEFSDMGDDKDSLEVMEVQPMIVDNRGCILDSSRNGVASYIPKGEVNVPLTHDSPPQSDAHLASTEAPVVRSHKTYQIEECFLATEDENTNFRDVPQLERSKSQDVLAIKNGYQGINFSALSFPSEFAFQNLIRIVPHIPRHIELCRFQYLNSLIGFPIKVTQKLCGKSRKRLKVLPSLQSSKLRKIEASANQHSSKGVEKFNVYVDDITRGAERLKIPLDGRNVEDMLTFFYILRNVVHKKANVHFALGRISNQPCCSHCYGDCLESPIPCACALQTGDGFAYTPEGLVKNTFLEECLSVNKESHEHHYFYCKKCPLEKFCNKKGDKLCKGHLLRKFIKECWSKCGCNKNCGNRIVQQGITAKLQVFFTPEGKGWGLRTLKDLPRGAFVCEYVGEIVTSTELHERNIHSAGKRQTYSVVLDANWCSKDVLKDEETLFLDSTVYGNVARFINHRCSDASLVQIPVEVETPDHQYYHLALFTTRNVAAMEELTWDYGIDFEDHDHPVKPFQCLCGSAICRGSKVKFRA